MKWPKRRRTPVPVDSSVVIDDVFVGTTDLHIIFKNVVTGEFLLQHSRSETPPPPDQPNTVIFRSRVTATQVRILAWQYHFQIVLDDGRRLAFTGIADGMKSHAIAAGVRRSQRMIDHGYQEGM